MAEQDRSPFTLLTFGHKHGPPPAADLLLDARILPNPYWVESLRDHSGLEPMVAAHALDNPIARQFIDLLLPLLRFVLQQTEEVGRKPLCIAIGCTGGRHRSVALAEELRRRLQAEGWPATVIHRDILQ
jgi:UPF0042 nucleotide-binding protein